MGYIGISEDRLHHILGVARKSYKIALERGHDEDFARKMFVLGWNHDIGYEFSTKPSEHPDISANILLDAFYGGKEPWGNIGMDSIKAILKHGKYPIEETEEWIILNQADMQVDLKGNEVSVTRRLDDIKERYGEFSDEYLTSCDICYRINLTAVNLAENHTA